MLTCNAANTKPVDRIVVMPKGELLVKHTEFALNFQHYMAKAMRSSQGCLYFRTEPSRRADSARRTAFAPPEWSPGVVI